MAGELTSSDGREKLTEFLKSREVEIDVKLLDAVDESKPSRVCRLSIFLSKMLLLI